MSQQKVLNEYKVLVKCDEPVKQTTLVLAPTTTFGQLKTQVAKALDLQPADVVSRYAFYGVAFGHDITPFGVKADKGDGEVLVESGLRDKSVVFVRAPLDIKPYVERKSKKQKAKEAAEEAAASSGYDSERFAGITPKNVFAKFGDAKSDAAKKKTLLAFVECFTPDVLKETDAWATLSADNLQLILKSDKLSAKESDILDAAVVWGKAQLKKAATSTDAKADLKTVMKGVTELIRFPAMDMSEVATKVAATGLLTSEQTLALYTYIGMRPTAGSGSGSGSGSDSKSVPLPAALSAFNPKPRTGATVQPIWDGTQSFTYNLYTCTNNNRTANKTGQNGTIYVIRERDVRTKGLHTIRVRCDSVGQPCPYNNDGIGFANEYYAWTNATLNGSGAATINSAGQITVDGSQRTNAGFTIAQGTTLTFTLDIEKKKFSVSNGSATSPVQDWHSCSGRVYFAMCWRQTGWSFTVLE